MTTLMETTAEPAPLEPSEPELPLEQPEPTDAETAGDTEGTPEDEVPPDEDGET